MRVKELGRPPQKKELNFEMHFAAKGTRAAYIYMGWLPKPTYYWDKNYYLYEIGKKQRISRISFKKSIIICYIILLHTPSCFRSEGKCRQNQICIFSPITVFK